MYNEHVLYLNNIAAKKLLQNKLVLKMKTKQNNIRNVQ